MLPVKPRVGVAAGAYTEILNIYGPSQALVGERVTIQVEVRNLAGYAISIAVTGTVDSTVLTLTPDYIDIPGGGSSLFSASFTMPNFDVTIVAYSWYWTGDVWFQDDSKTVSIRVNRTAWIPLASTSLLVKKALVGGWVPLASTTLLVKKALVGGWVPLASATLLVSKGVVGGWVPLATGSLDLSAGPAPGRDVFKDLAVEFSKHRA